MNSVDLDHELRNSSLSSGIPSQCGCWAAWTSVVWGGLLEIPLFVLRLFIHAVGRLWVHFGYRLLVEGLGNIPRHGGALLVCNHPSYTDPLLLQAAVRRGIRFVMYRPYYEKLWLKVPCRALHVIPIDGEDAPREMLRSLKQVRRLIQSGRLVCVFAEGGVTRTGRVEEFKRGVEVIMRGLNAPIIPVGLGGVWGAFMSFAGGRLCLRPPFRRPVSVQIGTPIAASSAAGEIRHHVCALVHAPEAGGRSQVHLKGSEPRASLPRAGHSPLPVIPSSPGVADSTASSTAA